MSIKGITWAVAQQKTTDPVARLILTALANFADQVGRACPSIVTLQAVTALSADAIRGKLRLLEECGLIACEESSAPVAVYHLKTNPV